MFSAPLFLNVTVPSLLVTVVLCEKVDIFTVRPSGPQLSIVCGHNCFLAVDYLCQTISAKSTTVFAGQSLKLRLIMHSINLHVGSNLNLQLIYTLLILSYRLFSPFGLIALLDL